MKLCGASGDKKTNNAHYFTVHTDSACWGKSFPFLLFALLPFFPPFFGGGGGGYNGLDPVVAQHTISCS